MGSNSYSPIGILKVFINSNDLIALKASLKKLSGIYNFDVEPDYNSLIGMARHYIEKKNYREAIEIYKFGLEAYPEGLMMNGFIAQAYLEDGQIEKSKEFFTKGLRVEIAKESPMISWFRDQLDKF